MPEDLNTGSEESQEIDIEFQSDSEYLTGAINVLELLEQIDTAMMTEKHRRGARKAKKQALDITFMIIDQWHQELFEPEADDDN